LGRVDGTGDRRDLRRSFDLKAVQRRPVIGVLFDVEEVVEILEQRF